MAHHSRLRWQLLTREVEEFKRQFKRFKSCCGRGFITQEVKDKGFNIIDRCRDFAVQANPIMTVVEDLLCSAKEYCIVLFINIEHTCFKFKIQESLTREFALGKVEKHKKQILKIIQQEKQQHLAFAPLLHVARVGHENPAVGEDWTSRFNGSVGNLQKAYEAGEIHIPTSGVFMKSRRQQRQYTIRLDNNNERIADKMFPLLRPNQERKYVKIEIMDPFFYPPSLLDKTSLFYPMNEPCAVSSVVEQLLQLPSGKIPFGLQNQIRSKFEMPPSSELMFGRLLSAERTVISALQGCNQFYLTSDYLTSISPYRVWFRITLTQADVHKSSSALELSYPDIVVLRNKRIQEFLCNISKSYKGMAAKGLEAVDNLVMLLGRKLYHAELEFLESQGLEKTKKLSTRMSTPSQSLNQIFLNIVFKEGLKSDALPENFLTIETSKLLASKFSTNTSILHVLVQFKLDATNNIAHMQQLLEATREWLLLHAKSYAAVIAAVDCPFVHWGDSKGKSHQMELCNIVLVDFFSDSTAIEVLGANCSFVVWPIILPQITACSHAHVQTHFAADGKNEDRQYEYYQKQMQNWTKPLFQSPVKPVDIVLTNLDQTQDWQLLSRLETLQKQPLVLSSCFCFQEQTVGTGGQSYVPPEFKTLSVDVYGVGKHKATSVLDRLADGCIAWVFARRPLSRIPDSMLKVQSLKFVQTHASLDSLKLFSRTEKEIYKHNKKKRFEVRGKALNVTAVIKGTIKTLLRLPPVVRDYLSICRDYPFTEKSQAPTPNILNIFDTEFMVIEKDALETAVDLSRKYGTRACVMNLSHDTAAGGRWTQIKGSQEESLMRNSSLWLSLWPRRNNLELRLLSLAKNFPKSIRRFYPIPEAGVLYSPNVAVIRDIDPEAAISGPLRCVNNWSIVSAVSAAAQDLRLKKYSASLTKQKIRSSIWASFNEKHEVLVLGAFGCGAFKNCPWKIARIYRELLYGEFKGAFRCVAFTIIKSAKNISAFQEIFASTKIGKRGSTTNTPGDVDAEDN